MGELREVQQLCGALCWDLHRTSGALLPSELRGAVKKPSICQTSGLSVVEVEAIPCRDLALHLSFNTSQPVRTRLAYANVVSYNNADIIIDN